MAIRIVHTADNHLGIPYRQYASDLSKRLVEERFEALGRLIETANLRQADFVVVAGDLFDSTRVTAAAIERAVGVLKGFAGTAVLVLPGNHDFYAGPETEVWKRFRRACEGVGNVELLADRAVRAFEVGGQAVEFFPCPCPSKTGKDSMIGWVSDRERNASANTLRIGVAHGNVTGLGLDSEGQYFNMEPAALEAAGMATWLLGHVHVAFPTAASGGSAPYFMAGTHTPDSLRCKHAGSAWFIECEGSEVVRFEKLLPGWLRFVRVSKEVVSADDIVALERECRGLDAASTILDLQISGRLPAAERRELDAAIERLRPAFLEVTSELDIRERLDMACIAKDYRPGGLAARLLSALVEGTEHPDAATLAHELIQEVSQS